MAIPIITNPSIPFVGQIEKFTPEQCIRIQGTISELTYGFNINLQCGPNGFPQQDDIALQISVRYFNGYTSLNSFRHDTWDKDLCISPTPIKCNEKFEIVIRCELRQYKVIINGSSQYDLPQRVTYDKISHLKIEGDVSIAQISYETVSKDPVVLNLADCPDPTNVVRLEIQPEPEVPPDKKKTPYTKVILVIPIIGIAASIIKLINIMNSNFQNDNLVYQYGGTNASSLGYMTLP